MDRSTFHAERRSGIGASDAAAVLGVSPWRTPIQVWRDKLATKDPPEPESGPLKRGIDLEPFILERAAPLIEQADLGKLVYDQPLFMRHELFEFMIAHPDALTCRAIVDAKAMSRSRYRELVDHGLDADYIVQGQHLIEVARFSGMMLAGCMPDMAVFACFNWEDWEGPVLLTVSRDEQMATDMIEVESEFWRHVEDRVPPPPPVSDLPAVSSKTQGFPEEGRDSLLEIVREIEFQSGVAKVAESMRKELTRKLTDTLKPGRYEGVQAGLRVRVSVTPVQGRQSFDHNALAARGAIDPWKLQWLLMEHYGGDAIATKLLDQIREECALDLSEFIDYGTGYTLVRPTVTEIEPEEEA